MTCEIAMWIVLYKCYASIFSEIAFVIAIAVCERALRRYVPIDNLIGALFLVVMHADVSRHRRLDLELLVALRARVEWLNGGRRRVGTPRLWSGVKRRQNNTITQKGTIHAWDKWAHWCACFFFNSFAFLLTIVDFVHAFRILYQAILESLLTSKSVIL